MKNALSSLKKEEGCLRFDVNVMKVMILCFMKSIKQAIILDHLNTNHYLEFGIYQLVFLIKLRSVLDI